MSGLLEGGPKRTFGLQRSMWLIALISVSVSVGGCICNRIFTIKDHLLRNMVTELIYGASNVASASEQISASSQSLSRGGPQNRQSIEETSATMEEITSMTKQNADNAREASKWPQHVTFRLSMEILLW